MVEFNNHQLNLKIGKTNSKLHQLVHLSNPKKAIRYMTNFEQSTSKFQVMPFSRMDYPKILLLDRIFPILKIQLATNSMFKIKTLQAIL
jgi:hypothetical protein